MLVSTGGLGPAQKRLAGRRARPGGAGVVGVRVVDPRDVLTVVGPGQHQRLTTAFGTGRDRQDPELATGQLRKTPGRGQRRTGEWRDAVHSGHRGGEAVATIGGTYEHDVG